MGGSFVYYIIICFRGEKTGHGGLQHSTITSNRPEAFKYRRKHYTQLSNSGGSSGQASRFLLSDTRTVNFISASLCCQVH